MVEYRLIKIHQIHFIDCQHDVGNAQQRRQKGVASSLREHPLRGIDKNNSHVRRRRTRYHVTRVLLMPGRVRHNKLAVIGAKETVSHINGNALLSFSRQAIYQKREINVATLGALLFGVLQQRRHLILKNKLSLIEHASDQGALAIVYAAAGNESQQVQLILLTQILIHFF